MTGKSGRNGRKFHQMGALLTLSILAIWGLGVLWLHLVTPAGADLFEMVYLGTLTIMILVLLPLYWRRYPWAYIGGLIVILAMLIGLGKAIIDQSLVFSWSLYNVLTILAYAVGLLCAYFSLRAYRAAGPSPTKNSLLGIGGLVLAMAAVAAVLWANTDLIRDTMWQWTLNRIDRRLQSLETLDEKIDFLLDEGDIDSATVGIVVNDELVWTQAYGEANPDTIYNIGSVTKPFVATAVLQLYERGLLDLDDDVNDHLPFSLRHPKYPDTPITVRLLLTHQSGLAHFSEQYMGYHMEEETADWLARHEDWQLPTFDQDLPFATFIEGYTTAGAEFYTPDAWTTNRPGTAYAYSTTGYDVLAYLVECITRQPFTVFARDNIFGPLGMNSSGFSVTDFPGRVALPYERKYGILSKANAELPLDDVNTIGGGGMLSTVPDLAPFMIAQLNQGQAKGVSLLEPETLALMQRPAVTFPLGSADLNQVSYGLGVGQIREEPWSAWGHLYDMHGATGHGGSWFGYQGQMWFVAEENGGYGIIILCNTEFDFKPEARGLWLFASPLKLQVLLMEEAAGRYQLEMGG